MRGLLLKEYLNRKRIQYLSIGVVWSDKEISTNFVVVNPKTENYDSKYTA